MSVGRIDRDISLSESTSNRNYNCNQPRNLHGSPKARHSGDTIMLSHWIRLFAASRGSLTGVKKRTRFWSVVMVWMGVRLCSGVGLLR